MFYFLLNIISYFSLIILVYSYLSKKRINILDFLLIIFISNIYIILIIKNINITIGLIITMIVLLIEKLYFYLYSSFNKNTINDIILINKGNVCFKGLINNNYSYQKLIQNLKKKGIKDLNKIDYCFLYNNELIVFKSDNNNYPISLIIDGKVIDDNLKCIKKDDFWLEKEISNNNLSLKDINYAFYKDYKIYFLLY